MSPDAWVELGLAALGGLNLFLQLMIKNELLKMELRLNEKFLSKNDFRSWTRGSSFLPTFGEKQHHANH